MATAIGAIQKAVYAALAGDAVLATKVTGIFDGPPDGQAFPYVTLGEATERPADTFAGRGNEATMTLHIWSQAASFGEALGILAEINRILDRAALAVTGFKTVMCAYEWSETLRDPDGVTRHVPVRFRFIVEQI